MRSVAMQQCLCYALFLVYLFGANYSTTGTQCVPFNLVILLFAKCLPKLPVYQKRLGAVVVRQKFWALTLRMI